MAIEITKIAVFFGLSVAFSLQGEFAFADTVASDSMQFMRNLPCTPTCSVDQLTAAGADRSGTAARDAQGDADRLGATAAQKAGLSDQIGLDLPRLRSSLAQIDGQGGSFAVQNRQALLSQAYSPPEEYRSLARSLGLATNQDLYLNGAEVRRSLSKEAEQLTSQAIQKQAAAQMANAAAGIFHGLTDVAINRERRMGSADPGSLQLKTHTASEDSPGVGIGAERGDAASEISHANPKMLPPSRSGYDLGKGGRGPKGELASRENTSKEGPAMKPKLDFDDAHDQARAAAELEKLISQHAADPAGNLSTADLAAETAKGTHGLGETGQSDQRSIGSGASFPVERAPGSAGLFGASSTETRSRTLFQRVSSRIRLLQVAGRISASL